MKIKEIFLKIKKFKKKESKLFSDIKTVSLMLIYSFSILYLFANKEKFYPENIMLYLESKSSSIFSSGNSKKVEGQTKEVINSINALEGSPIVLSNTNFNVLNDSGSVTRSEYHSLGNPNFKVCGIRSILYDVGGKKYRLESQPKTLYKGETEENIISCDINESGEYGILTQSHEYLSEVSVYDTKNSEKYRYSFSKCHACDISIDSSGNKCVVAGVYFENEKINSSVYTLNFKSESPDDIFNLEDNVVMSVKYFRNGNILAIGDKYTAVINPATKKVKRVEYGPKYLKFYSFKKDYGVVCCFSPSLDRKNDDELMLIDNLGEKNEIIKTGENLRSISHHKDRIVGVSDKKILVYNLEGRYEGYLITDKLFEKIFLTSDSTLYACQNSTVEKIKINDLEK